MSSTETEKSEPEKPCARPSGRGRGRGRACKRPAATRPQMKLQVPDDVSTSSSDQSPESKRIRAAVSSWNGHQVAGKRKAAPCSEETLSL